MAKKAYRGLDKFNKRLPVIVRNVKDAIDQQLKDDANDLLRRSNALSPQLEGDHIESGKVVDLGDQTVAVTYDQPYSVFLHESRRYNLGPRSILKPGTEDGPVGRRFLSRPFDNQKAIYIRNSGRAVADAIRRSVN